MTPEPASLCLGCWQNLHLPVPLRGPWSAPFRLFGVRPSRMNPNTSTLCEMAFTRIMKARAVTIDATVMFADLRGYTALAQTVEREGLTSLLDVFYDECAAAIWRYDGLLNKTLGDAVFAIFNFPVRNADPPHRRCSRHAKFKNDSATGTTRSCKPWACRTRTSASASIAARPTSVNSAVRIAT